MTRYFPRQYPKGNQLSQTKRTQNHEPDETRQSATPHVGTNGPVEDRKEGGWITRKLGFKAWMHNQRDELISQLAEQAGEQAAAQFQPAVDRVIRYAKLAAWFGIAGFVVGLLALFGFLVVILELL